jgi:hypothetical protein
VQRTDDERSGRAEAPAGAMACPRCRTAPLAERVRDGVHVDVCRSCRGVWLDRGELEELAERMARPTDDEEDDEREDEDDGPFGGGDDDGPRRGARRGGGGFFDRLGELFD